MKEAFIVKAAISQADGKVKLRPALLLRKLQNFDDFLACGISSKTYHYIDGFDEIIEKDDSDYKESGLLHPSLIRLGFLAVVHNNSIAGSIGIISPERHKRLLLNLANYLLNRSKNK